MKKLFIFGVIIFLTPALFAQETLTAAIKQTVRTEDGWKIIYIVYTTRKDNCKQ